MKAVKNYSLRQHNTFGIEARCRCFYEYTTLEELQQILQQIKEEPGIPFLHIGGGSNLLFVGNYSGNILHSNIKGIEVDKETQETVFIRAASGENWDDFVAHCVEKGWYGLENLSLIPGEVGASAVQNIGAYGSEVAQFIECVETVEISSGNKRIFTNKECHFAYRESIFKKELKGQYIVTAVLFKLKKKFQPDFSYAAVTRELEKLGISKEELTAKQLRLLICNIRREKLPEPQETGSAGSFFMNPVVSKKKFEQLLSIYPQMPYYELDNGVKIPAGWLIQETGWKGKRVGDAGVWPKQALVLVNHGNASGKDIYDLSQRIICDVEEKFGICLVPETNIFL